MNTTDALPQENQPGRKAWLVAARAAWVVITVLVLALVLAGLPGRFISLLAGYERSLGGTAIRAGRGRSLCHRAGHGGGAGASGAGDDPLRACAA